MIDRIIELKITDDGLLDGVDGIAFVEKPAIELEFLAFNREEFETFNDYPKKAKAFYHYPDPKNPEKVKCADLLAPGGYGEIIGGGQRIDDVEVLIQRIQEEQLDPEDYEWYVDLRKYGSVPHAGFGLGVERVIRWLLKLENIRDTIPFPRTINRIYP